MCVDKIIDPIARKQIQDFIQKKSFYEWGNLCGNSMEIENCQNFLHIYSKLSIYSKYINNLNTKIQAHFNNMTNQLVAEQVNLENKEKSKKKIKSFSKSLSKSPSKSPSRSQSDSHSSQYSFHSL